MEKQVTKKDLEKYFEKSLKLVKDCQRTIEELVIKHKEIIIDESNDYYYVLYYFKDELMEERVEKIYLSADNAIIIRTICGDECYFDDICYPCQVIPELLQGILTSLSIKENSTKKTED